MSNPATFTWIGTTGGDWNIATNWADVTTGQVPAVTVPGSLDAVIFGNTGTAVAVSGDGSAACITVQGNDTVLRALNVGTLVISPTGSLEINAGAIISAGAVIDNGSISRLSITGSGATLLVSGTLLLTQDDFLTATNGGLIQASSLVLAPDSASGLVSVDGDSTIEIGNAMSAAAGAITIAPGATFSAEGNVSTLVRGNIVDDGDIAGGELTFQLGNMSGTGTLEVTPDATVYGSDAVTSPGLTFQIDGGGDLAVEAPIAAGNTIAMIGFEAELQVLSNLMISPGAVPTVDAVITGFNATDTLLFDGGGITTADFNAGTTGTPGTLSLLSGNETVASLFIAGDIQGETFAVLPYAEDSEIILVPNNAPSSSGTAGADTYSWIGPSGGYWNATTNWEVVTAEQTPAVVAPGSLDVATISHSGSASALLTGNVDVASLTVLDNWTLAGNLNVGTLVVSQGANVTIETEVTVNAAMAAVDGTLVLRPEVGGNVSGASLLVSGTLTIGSTSHSGTLSAPTKATALVLGDNPANVVDASGVLVGDVVPASSYGLLIERGFTVSGQGSLDGAVADDGLIVGTNLTIYGYPSLGTVPPPLHYEGEPLPEIYTFSSSFSGTGSVKVQSGGTVDLAEPLGGAGMTFQLDGTADLGIQASIASGNTIDLIGNMNTILIDAKYYTEYDPNYTENGSLAYSGFPNLPTVDMVVNGFNDSDSIILLGDTIARTAFTNGTLSFQDVSFDFAGLNGATTFSVGAVSQPPGQESQQAITIGPAISCFAAGTHIVTPLGAVPVNRLREGDAVLTISGKPQPIRWTGRRRVDCRRHPAPEQVMPIRIVRDAFGENLPKRSLLLSPDHSIFIDGVLIPVKYLVNGTTIAQVPRREVTYYHVELPRHDLLLAEGLPVESYLDVGDRSNFVDGGDVIKMHPSFALDEAYEAIWECAGCAPLRIVGEELDRVVTRLHARAMLLERARDRKTLRRSRQRRVKATDLTRLLNPVWYLANNPDVATAGVDAAVHYVTWGRQEGRLPCQEIDLVLALGLVDAGTVAFTMADVIAAGVDPVAHFCSIGWRERRRPNPYFDTSWYLDTHDVPVGMNPLLHYVLIGEPRGLPPSPHFDPAWYRDHYEIGPASSPLAHYLKHRRSQRFSPLPTFDVVAYIKEHAVTLRPDRDAYAHFLVVGRSVLIRRGQAGRLAA